MTNFPTWGSAPVTFEMGLRVLRVALTDSMSWRKGLSNGLVVRPRSFLWAGRTRVTPR